ncbi:GNAT family N-acetyltransferase [Paenibacillus sp. NFR01]|uniref:GNAT family N-acetyltransferase n=1 Tax=Paenibacillus sp. NFR01 TaxID=1566279 RepID=UPI0008BA435C|nr:GNAT family N-acetyltransferase [Paenibacillus sp. NFR01]SET94176.1 Ribosomal protein S18 acetylase RimI [Paenibacillus sp. NFR01]
MTAYIIRSVNEQDITFLWEMLFESIYTPEGQEAANRDIINNPSLSKYVEGWGREGDRGYIAVNDLGDSLGSITLRYFNKDNKGYGYVNDETPELGMAIRAEHRGRGIGTELLKTLLEQAKIEGINSISLSVDPNNPAIRLYKRFGFKEVGMEGTSITMMVNL